MNAAMRARLSVLVAVLMALLTATAVHVGADETIEDDAGAQEPPSELVCPGMIQTLHNDYIPEAEMRGAPANPRAALARFLSFDHQSLRASEFRQTRATSHSAHFVLEMAGRAEVTAEVEQYGDGWLVMEMASCADVEPEDAQ